MSRLKVHWAVAYTAYGERRVRSLCNRSAPSVIDVEAITSGQNVTSDPKKVTCKGCARMIERRPSLLEVIPAHRGRPLNRSK